MSTATKIILMRGEKLGDTVEIRDSDGVVHRYKVVSVDRGGLGFPVGYLEEYPKTESNPLGACPLQREVE